MSCPHISSKAEEYLNKLFEILYQKLSPLNLLISFGVYLRRNHILIAYDGMAARNNQEKKLSDVRVNLLFLCSVIYCVRQNHDYFLKNISFRKSV